MSSMPAALLLLSAAIRFLYSSSLNADTNNYGFPSTVGSAGHLGFVGIVPWPLTSRWYSNITPPYLSSSAYLAANL